MRKYGLSIGSSGVEFSTREDREKALLMFTKGSTVKISTTGIRYSDTNTTFGTYERESNEVLVSCSQCSGVFSIECCGKRASPVFRSWSKKWETEEAHICDGCFTQRKQDKEIADAKQKLQDVGETP